MAHREDFDAACAKFIGALDFGRGQRAWDVGNVLFDAFADDRFNGIRGNDEFRARCKSLVEIFQVADGACSHLDAKRLCEAFEPCNDACRCIGIHGDFDGF